MSTYTAEQIIRIGGKEWRKGDRHRVYINRHVLQRLLGLEVQYYNTGNIRHAELRGQHISNSEARRILASEIFWEDGELHIRSASHWHRQDIIDAINAAIAATEPQKDDDTADDTDGSQGGDASDATGQGAVEQAAAPQQTAAAEMAVSRLTALRQAGLTAREIAQMIGCAVSTVYRWLRGAHRPNARYATAILAIA
ncbi:MAG: helix-turn-helix transcriptional regulator [Actinomycetes bacterium]